MHQTLTELMLLLLLLFALIRVQYRLFGFFNFKWNKVHEYQTCQKSIQSEEDKILLFNPKVHKVIINIPTERGYFFCICRADAKKLRLSIEQNLVILLVSFFKMQCCFLPNEE